MSFRSNPPPTYADLVLDDGSDVVKSNPIWLKWFVDLATILNSFTAGGIIAGDVTVNTLNKITITPPTTSATFTLADGKTFAVNNSLALSGTDSTVMTFPATSATIARTDAGQTFAGQQVMSSKIGAAGGLASSDGSAGISGTLTTADLVGKTLTFKDGIITGYA